jgi:putative FmdB family regulatory protein
MPTYEYKCDRCGYRFEKFQRMTDPRLTECPQCQGAIRRLIGAGAGIIFKGSGFYCTDYRKPSEPAKASEAPAPAAKS